MESRTSEEEEEGGVAREPAQQRRVGLREGWAVNANGGALRQEPTAGGREGGVGGGKGEVEELCLFWDPGNLGAESASGKRRMVSWICT